MRTSANYNFKLPEGTDNVKRQDLVDNFESIDANMKELATQSSDMMYQTAGGTATALTLTIKGTLVTGYPITFIASANNGGVATTINGKKLYKPATTSSPTLIVGKAYTVWYNSSGDSGNGCFFIKASATGTVTSDKVLAGETYSTEVDTDLVGTMLNNGAVNQSLVINGNYTIPKGYHDGNGKVTQSITTKATATITPKTTDQTIAEGQYLSGIQTIKGDANLLASNILSGMSIFGVAGNVAGLKNVSGSYPSLNASLYFNPASVVSFNVLAWYATCTYVNSGSGITYALGTGCSVNLAGGYWAKGSSAGAGYNGNLLLGAQTTGTTYTISWNVIGY